MARNRTTNLTRSCSSRPAMRWCRSTTNSSGGTLNSVSSPPRTTSQNRARASGDSLSIRPAISSSIISSKGKGPGHPEGYPSPGPCSLLAALCLQQFGPHNLDIMLGESTRIVTGLQYRVVSGLTRIQVNEVAAFVRPVERQVRILASDGGELLSVECVLYRVSLHIFLLVVVSVRQWVGDAERLLLCRNTALYTPVATSSYYA